jgi:adenylate cyclase
MRPERRELTVYFSDIEGFTAVAHEKNPEEVVQVLRAYLQEMTTVVLDSHGHVDKYLGDGLMAFWGAPVALPNQVEAACKAALEMQKRFELNREAWQKQCGRTLLLRAGFDVGPTVVGEMGTLHRVNYTVMGEPVAASYRLESLAKTYGARILVGPRVPELAGPKFAFREVDSIRLNRSSGVEPIFELLGPDADRAELMEWSLAMTAYKDRHFIEARAIFQKLAPTVPLASRYVRRCEKLLQSPPVEPWDGSFND